MTEESKNTIMEREERIKDLVRQTSELMLKRLLLPENMSKTEWFEMDFDYLYQKFLKRFEFLSYIIHSEHSDEIISTSVDLINYLAFIVDIRNRTAKKDYICDSCGFFSKELNEKEKRIDMYCIFEIGEMAKKKKGCEQWRDKSETEDNPN